MEYLGISALDAEKKLKQFGANELVYRKRKPWWKRFFASVC